VEEKKRIRLKLIMKRKLEKWKNGKKEDRGRREI
jgi:hypothetical protein